MVRIYELPSPRILCRLSRNSFIFAVDSMSSLIRAGGCLSRRCLCSFFEQGFLYRLTKLVTSLSAGGIPLFRGAKCSPGLMNDDGRLKVCVCILYSFTLQPRKSELMECASTREELCVRMQAPTRTPETAITPTTPQKSAPAACLVQASAQQCEM
jgi:hypothetical protein